MEPQARASPSVGASDSTAVLLAQLRYDRADIAQISYVAALAMDTVIAMVVAALRDTAELNEPSSPQTAEVRG